MSKKKILFSVLALSLLSAICFLIYKGCINRSTNQSTLNPILGYSIEEEKNLPLVTKTFLQQVSFEEKEKDAKKGIVSFNVSVPNISGILQEVVDTVSIENPSLDYEEQLNLARERVAVAITDPSLPKREQEITLVVNPDTGNIIPSEELYDFLFYDFRVMRSEGIANWVGGE